MRRGAVRAGHATLRRHRHVTVCGFVIVLTLAWVGLFTLVAAAESQIQTRYDGQRLDFHLDVLLSAPEAHVVAVIHDYDRLVLVFPLVVDSGLLEDFGNGVQRVRAHMKGCVLVFCRQLKHVLDVHPSPGAGAWGSARSVPGQSDVRAGHLSWRTEAPSPEQTRLTLSGWLEPDVWVPPLLGPPVVRRAVERHFREAMPRLEEAARNWLPPEP